MATDWRPSDLPRPGALRQSQPARPEEPAGSVHNGAMEGVPAGRSDRTTLLAFGAPVVLVGSNLVAIRFSNRELAPFRTPGGHRIAVYQRTRPEVVRHFEGRRDF